LGAIGFAMCMMTPTIGKFIWNAPANPLAILGYLLGVIALFITAAQIFKWNIPFIYDPRIALLMVAFCIIVKSVLGRFAPFIV
jgi:hypothetical protein